MSEPACGSSGPVTTLTFIRKNGGILLIRGGHQYYARRKHKSGLEVWACTKRRRCKGLLRLKNGQILEETAHDSENCIPDFAKNDVHEALHELKSKLSEPNFPSVPKTYNSVLGDLKDAGINIITEIPTFGSVKSSLYRHRNSEAGVSKMQHKEALQVEVPSRYQDFLLADYKCDDDNTRIIVFSSMEARKTMCEATDFYGDGTFKSCPIPFGELYTIHADIGSTMNHTNIIPLVYALMSSRKTQTYVTLFQIIKSQLPEWNPNRFKVDFEKAAMKAISMVFPSAILKGCYYHYNKAIFKKGKDLKMKDHKEARLVQLSAVLPLLPEEQIMHGWVYITARYGDDEDSTRTKAFLEYMEKQWLREEFIRVWCVFGETHRTTNALEAWHNKLNKAVGMKSPNLMHFLNSIKNDSSQHTVRNVMRQQMKTPKRKRDNMIILKDEFIQEVQLELTQGLVTVGHALEILRH